MVSTAPPVERMLNVNGLVHRVCSWGTPGADHLVLLLHGYLDTARSLDGAATLLAQALPGVHVAAPDWRGHGDTQWAPPGAYYHFYDYVADLAALVRALPHRRLSIVGHSMGGNIATYYTGAMPEGVGRLALLESLLVPDSSHASGPHRVKEWLTALEGDPRGRTRILPSLEDVARRLRITMTHLSHEDALALAHHASRPVEGGYAWRFDPLHRTRSPSPFRWERIRPFLKKIECPVLLCEGEHTPVPREELDARYAEIPMAWREVIPGAAHALHVEAPEALAAVLVPFLSGP